MKMTYIRGIADGIICGLLWNMVGEYSASVYARTYLWGDRMFIVLCGILSAVSLYFCFRNIEKGMWRGVCLSLITTLAVVLLWAAIKITVPFSMLHLREMNNADGIAMMINYIGYFIFSVFVRAVLFIFVYREYKRNK